MCHTLSKEHKNICNQIKNWKSNNKENKEESFLILEKPILDEIIKADLTPTSKLILIFLLSKVHYSFNHLYVYLPYKLLEIETGIKKATAINSLKDLEDKGFIKLHSGTNRKENNNIKEFIFQQKQEYYNPMRNQQNIVEMTPFYKKLFKVEK